MSTRSVGASYESTACEFLERKGYKILERNYRVKIGEIDIIASDGETLVFVEVKYRKSDAQGGAEHAISRGKQRTIARVAQWYMAEKDININRTYCRFDAVLIDADEITHIENAWRV